MTDGLDHAGLRRRHAGVAAIFILLALPGACGRDDAGDAGPSPVACAISDITTGSRAMWRLCVDPPVHIRWEHAGDAAVRIVLTKGGVAVATIADSTDNDGYHLWAPDLAGQEAGDDFGLRIASLADPECAAELGGLTLLDYCECRLEWTTDLPENVLAGTALALTWLPGSASGEVDLELWQDDLGGVPELVGTIAIATPDDGQYLWEAVDSFNYGSNAWFTLRIADTVVPACEAFTPTFQMWDDTVCSILLYGFPAGAVFTEGQAIDLTLAQTGGSGRVRLQLYAGAYPVPGGSISGDAAVDQVLRWIVDDYGYSGTERTFFRIRTTDLDDPYCVGISDRFTIR